MVTSAVTNTTPSVRVRNLPATALPVGRITAAVVIIAGATLQLIEELIEPPFPTETERFAWMAQHTTLHAVDVGIGLAAIERANYPGWAFNTAFILGLLALAALATVPLKGVRLATNLFVVICSIFLAGQIAWIYKAPVDPVTVGSPLSGEWYVVQGGRTALVNGHNVAVAQDYALDLLQEMDGRTHAGDPTDLANYYAWGEPVRVPADGVIATVIKKFPDQPIGSVDRQNPPDNQVVVDIGRGRFIAFGHLQSGSIKVSAGERVQRGEIIGLVGNSGNSDEPHLHVQAQNNAVFAVNSPPPGLITYSLLFDDSQVQRGGRMLTGQLADLRRGDRFSTTN